MWQQIIFNFGFQALWSPVFIIITLLIAGLYLWAVGSGRQRFDESIPVPVYKKVLFLIGLFFFYFGVGGPLNLIGNLMFSTHMVQMVVILFIAPPLLLLGTPSWLLKALVLKIPFRRAFRIFGHPVPGIMLFSGLFSFYHFPAVFDYLMIHKTPHHIYQTLLFIAALIKWWAIVVPVPEWNQLSELKRIGLLFLDGVLLTPACAMIAFSNIAFYTTFTNPEIWAQALSLRLPFGQTVSPDLYEKFMLFPLLADQKSGGILMKLAQEVMNGIFIGYVFIQWIRKAKQEDEKEKLEWSSLDKV